MSDKTRDQLFRMFLWRANDHKNELETWERKYSIEKDDFYKEMIEYYKKELKELYDAAKETLGEKTAEVIKKTRFSN